MENSKTYEKELGDISGNPQYDAARANWGGSWRLPSEAEFEELRNQCTWTWAIQGGHKGYQVTDSNGNSIFLPAAGCRYLSLSADEGDRGYYWSSSPNENYTQYAYGLGFDSSGHNVYWGSCNNNEFSVRPVSE